MIKHAGAGIVSGLVVTWLSGQATYPMLLTTGEGPIMGDGETSKAILRQSGDIIN